MVYVGAKISVSPKLLVSPLFTRTHTHTHAHIRAHTHTLSLRPALRRQAPKPPPTSPRKPSDSDSTKPTTTSEHVGDEGDGGGSDGVLPANLVTQGVDSMDAPVPTDAVGETATISSTEGSAAPSSSHKVTITSPPRLVVNFEESGDLENLQVEIVVTLYPDLKGILRKTVRRGSDNGGVEVSASRSLSDYAGEGREISSSTSEEFDDKDGNENELDFAEEPKDDDGFTSNNNGTMNEQQATKLRFAEPLCTYVEEPQWVKEEKEELAARGNRRQRGRGNRADAGMSVDMRGDDLSSLNEPLSDEDEDTVESRKVSVNNYANRDHFYFFVFMHDRVVTLKSYRRTGRID